MDIMKINPKKMNIMKMLKVNPNLIYWLFLTIYILGGLTATVMSIIYNYNKEYVGIAFLFGAFVAILLKHKYNYLEIKENIVKENHVNLFKISIMAYCVLFVMLIFIFLNSQQQYYLPLEYFIAVFLISSIILSQILLKPQLSNTYEKIILLEIFLLSTVVFSSFLFLFPSPYGNDAPYHVRFIENSINAGFLTGEGQYENYPLFHLLFIYIVELCKIENFKAVQFILLVVQNIVILLGFVLTKKLFNNSKIALIVSLFLLFAPYISEPKYFYFPGAFTSILFMLCIFLIFNPKITSLKYSILLILSFIALIIAHPMTPVILIAALIIFLTTSKFNITGEKNSTSTPKKITLTSILLVLTVTISWWMKPSNVSTKDLFSYSILSIKNAIESVDYTAVGRATLAPIINQWTIISSDLGFIILLTLAIVGAIYILSNFASNPSKYKDFKINSIHLAIITLIFIPIPYILAIIYPQSLPNRWFPFIEIFACIFAGFSSLIIFNSISLNKIKYTYILGLAGLIFLLVSSPIANPNSHIYAQDISTRSALTYSEIDASQFINQYSNITTVKGNAKYITFITQAQFSNFIDPGNSSTYNAGLVILRNYDIEKGFTIPLFGSKNKLLDNIYPPKEFFEFLDNSNEVYSNGNLKMYYNGAKP